MKKRSIIFLCEFYRPHWTGIAQVAVTLAEEWAKKETVAVMTTQLDSTQPRFARENNVSIYRVPYQFKLSRSNYSLLTILEFIKRASGFDTVFIHSPHSNILPIAIIAKLFNKKLLIFQHGDLILPKQTGNRIVNACIQTVYDVCTIASYTLSDRLLTQTKDYAKHSRLMKYFMHKFTPYIFSLRPFIGENKKLSLELERLKKTYVLIGFAGRFVEEKGFDILLDAIPFVIDKIPNALFVFAGALHIPYERFFEKKRALLEKNNQYIKNLGLLDDRGLKAFYKHLDCFVTPSRSDCFPFTQIEAMSFGVPSVVTNIPGARVPVAETGFGTIVTPNNTKSLATGIIYTIKNAHVLNQNAYKLQVFLKRYEHIENI